MHRQQLALQRKVQRNRMLADGVHILRRDFTKRDASLSQSCLIDVVDASTGDCDELHLGYMLYQLASDWDLGVDEDRGILDLLWIGQSRAVADEMEGVGEVERRRLNPGIEADDVMLDCHVAGLRSHT